MKKFNAIGLMSGTSMDGIDVALIKSDGRSEIERGPGIFVPYSEEVRKKIENALIMAPKLNRRDSRPGDIGDLERELTLLHADAVSQFLEAHDMDTRDIDLIGFHGQTIFHKPEIGLTIQLGDGDLLARQTGRDVVFDLRANDMVKGGQGAPLVPVYHKALARGIVSEHMGWEHDEKRPLAFVNIGGISNITFISSDDELVAFDSGPGNNLIDQWMQLKEGLKYDAGGDCAKQGAVIEEICIEYLEHPYFQMSIPKSLDRGDFKPFTNTSVSTEDGARSLARVTAMAIILSINQLPELPEAIIVCGGGVYNEVLMDDLSTLANQIGTKIIVADKVGCDSEYMEAEAFAYLAIRSALGEDITFPMTTGCTIAVTGGKIAKYPDAS